MSSKTTKDRIAEYLKKRSNIKSLEISDEFDISRQMATRYLKELVQEGVVERSGSRRNAAYSKVSGRKLDPTKKVKLVRKLEGLEEDRVFDEVNLRLNLEGELSKKAFNISFYAFTEILNNAIDHSDSEKAEIIVSYDERNFTFSVRDKGKGIFAHAQKIFQLNSEYEALEHILKGKQTTMPSAHSGQGIFFTSRISDKFSIRSHKIRFEIDNKSDGRLLEEESFIKGTLVQFQINKNTRKDIQRLFEEYSNADFEFDRTEIRVKLKEGVKYVSRSQAKRLLMGLEKFNIVRWDFRGIKGVGQAFVDEIFRVYFKRFPHVQMIYENANSAVEYMIKRAMKGRES